MMMMSRESYPVYPLRFAAAAAPLASPEEYSEYLFRKPRDRNRNPEKFRSQIDTPVPEALPPAKTRIV